MPVRNVMFKVTAGATPGQIIYPDNTTGSAEIYTAREDVYTTEDDYRDYAVRKPQNGSAYSYERWLQVWWGDAGDTAIGNVRFYFTGALPTGWAMRIGVNEAYKTPGNTPDDTVTPYTTTSITAGSSMALAAHLSGGIYKSDYIVLQQVVPSTTPSTGSATLSLVLLWDEV